MTDSLSSLKSKIGEKLSQGNPYEKYGFLSNPFPKAGEPTSNPLHNQEQVNKIFEGKFLTFIEQEGTSSVRILLHADHRGGKTNFLLHWHDTIRQAFIELEINKLKPIYLTISSDNFIDDIYKKLILDFESNQLVQMLNYVVERKIEISKIIPEDSDLKRAIQSTCEVNQTQQSFIINENKFRLFVKWISGEKCNQTDLRSLGNLYSNITTSTLAIKYLHQLMKIFREANICSGLLIFLDEFELIFGESVTRAKRARFLQDLRHFFDTFTEGLFFAAATTSSILTELQTNYAALKGRFGDPLELSPIRDIQDALGYANAYLDYGRKAFEKINPNTSSNKFSEIISREEIEEIYNQVAKEYRGSQGWFFAKLHEQVEKKVKPSEP